ncbi:MAG: protein N-lysine methyltransferase family protein [Thermoleophilia bacterium]|nr:protein N-lysine methyltransferase family protein [Thermoleophilia bacterium]
MPEGFDVVEDEVRAGGVTLTVAHPRSAEDLIDEADYARDERLPYWADLWPSGRALADEVARRPLRGLRVVELGCGVGLASLVAAAHGAHVLATDWYEDALAFVRLNADRARPAGRVETMVVDWFAPPPALLERAPFDLVMAADVLYEERNGPALLDLLPRLCDERTEVVIADPRRPHAAALIAPATAAGWGHTRDEVPVAGRADESGWVIHLHRLRPPRKARTAPGG